MMLHDLEKISTHEGLIILEPTPGISTSIQCCDVGSFVWLFIVGVLCRLVKFFHSKVRKHFFVDLALCTVNWK